MEQGITEKNIYVKYKDSITVKTERENEKIVNKRVFNFKNDNSSLNENIFYRAKMKVIERKKLRKKSLAKKYENLKSYRDSSRNESTKESKIIPHRKIDKIKLKLLDSESPFSKRDNFNRDKSILVREISMKDIFLLNKPKVLKLKPIMKSSLKEKYKNQIRYIYDNLFSNNNSSIKTEKKTQSFREKCGKVKIKEFRTQKNEINNSKENECSISPSLSKIGNQLKNIVIKKTFLQMLPSLIPDITKNENNNLNLNERHKIKKLKLDREALDDSLEIYLQKIKEISKNNNFSHKKKSIIEKNDSKKDFTFKHFPFKINEASQKVNFLQQINFSSINSNKKKFLTNLCTYKREFHSPLKSTKSNNSRNESINLELPKLEQTSIKEEKTQNKACYCAGLEDDIFFCNGNDLTPKNIDINNFIKVKVINKIEY